MIASVNSSENIQGPQSNQEGGGRILVRVLRKLPSGKYLVSAGGNRIEVSSLSKLVPGDVFRASVSSENGRILISPEKNIPAQPAGSPVLERMGFPSDGIASAILSFLTASGARIDRNLMARAKSVALKFPGKEKAAAEVGALLLEKGMEPTQEAVAEILSCIGESGADEDQCSEDSSGSGCSEDECPEILERLFGGNVNRPEGILALSNHLMELDSGGRHWVVVPFEWNVSVHSARGMIAFLLDVNDKLCEKIRINCEFPWKKYSFVVYLNESKVREVRFCTLPPLLASEIPMEEKRLGDSVCSGMNIKSVPVTYSTLASSDGLLSFDEGFTSVRQTI